MEKIFLLKTFIYGYTATAVTYIVEAIIYNPLGKFYFKGSHTFAVFLSQTISHN